MLVVALPACATTTESKVFERAAQNPARRHKLFEANVEMLDRHPEWVDELFEVTRKHRVTLERFTANQSRALETDPMIAEITARQFRAHPKAIEVSMRHILDQLRDSQAGRHAAAEAMKSRADVSAEVIVSDSEALGQIARAMAKRAKDDPKMRDQLKDALKDALK